MWGRLKSARGFSPAAWLPALSMTLVSMISYIDRNTLALLAPTILRDTHLTNQQYGFIISAFSIAYMLGNPLWGSILDRIGVRAGMTAAVAVWTLASVSHVFAAGAQGFGAARAILGFGEGATFPGGLRTVVQTLPATQRSRGIAVAFSGGSLGALITPIIITPIAAAWGWRGAFWFTGALGAVWLVLWGLLAKRDALVAAAPTGHASVRWKDRRVWAFMAAYAFGAFPAGFVLYQSSLYLSDVLHKSQVEIGRLLWIPPLGWEVGYFFWGWTIDRFASAGASVPGMRRQFLAMTCLSLPLALVPRTTSLATAMAVLFLVMFVSGGFITGSVAYASSKFSEGSAGLTAGLGAGSWSAVVGLVMPGIGRLFDIHQYGVAFGLATLFPIAAYVLWTTLTSTEQTAN